MASIMVEMNRPEYGLERFKVKVKEKQNVRSDTVEVEFRTRPYKEVASIVIGSNKTVYDAQDKLIEYYKNVGIMSYVLSMRAQL